MINYHRAARALMKRRSLSRFSCQRLFLPVLMGMMLLAAGCAKKQPSQLVASQQAPSSRIEQKLDIIEAARSNIGVPYRFGGTSPATGFDCSGLVCWSYQQVGIQLPRSARDQIMFGSRVERQEDLKPGDIVVFKGTRGRTGWHSGIYTGEGKFVHSPSTGKTVTESRLDEDYYARRFAGARRIPRDGSATEMYAQYEAEQKASAMVARESKSSRKAMLTASAKTGGKGSKVSADKSGKNTKTKAGKNGKSSETQVAASKSGLIVADAGKAGRTKNSSSKAGDRQAAGKSASKGDSGKKGEPRDKQPVASTAKPKKDGSIQADKAGSGKAAGKSKNKKS